jgi:glycine oxidase
MLAPSVRGGLLAPADGSIDPRRLSAALLTAVERLGGTLVRERVTEVLTGNGRATGVRLESGTDVHADQVVLAAGPWTQDLKGVPPGLLPPVRPVKGQVLRLRSETPVLGRSIRGLVRGSSVYLVPRTDGELVVGATQEEMGFDTTVTAGGLWELLRDARELLPGITELAFTEVTAGLRPGSPDNAPMMGATALPGLLLATGHFRNGVLYTPVTGDVMAELLATGEMPEVARPFSPGRF